MRPRAELILSYTSGVCRGGGELTCLPMRHKWIGAMRYISRGRTACPRRRPWKKRNHRRTRGRYTYRLHTSASYNYDDMALRNFPITASSFPAAGNTIAASRLPVILVIVILLLVVTSSSSDILEEEARSRLSCLYIYLRLCRLSLDDVDVRRGGTTAGEARKPCGMVTVHIPIG